MTVLRHSLVYICPFHSLDLMVGRCLMGLLVLEEKGHFGGWGGVVNFLLDG